MDLTHLSMRLGNAFDMSRVLDEHPSALGVLSSTNSGSTLRARSGPEGWRPSVQFGLDTLREVLLRRVG